MMGPPGVSSRTGSLGRPLSQAWLQSSGMASEETSFYTRTRCGVLPSAPRLGPLGASSSVTPGPVTVSLHPLTLGKAPSARESPVCW